MRKIFTFMGVLILFFSSGVLAAAFGNSYGGSFSNTNSNWQSYQPTFDRLYSGDFSNYWPILNDMRDGQCNATTDFVIGIPPGGCSPGVVTSDLLAEQNVPVFCELYAIKVNPLIKVSSIRSISFKGDYPEGVRSVVYHPARAAIKSYSTLLGSPTLENIGYVVIILKQDKVEANMTEWISGNLTATMRYDAEEAYGVGRGDYYLEPMSDSEWGQHYMESAFWRGRGFLRVLDVGDGQARIQVMRDKDRVLRTLTLKEGETSSSSYLPGFYCKAGLRLKLTDITTQEDMARLNVDGEDIWVREGSKFLDGKCSVRRLDVRGNNDGSISISCSGAGRIKDLSLTGVGARFKVGVDEKEYKIGAKIADKGWYLAYIGNYPKGVDEEEGYIIGILSGDKKAKDSSTFSIVANKLIREEGSKGDFLNKFMDLIKVIDGDKRKVRFFEQDASGSKDDDLDDVKFLGADNVLEDEGRVRKYFDKSVYVVEKELVEDYGSEEKEIGGTWAEAALYDEIVLAGEIGKFATKKRLMDLFLDKYPLATTAPYVSGMRRKLDGTDYSNSYVSAYVGNEFKSISVVDFKVVGEGEKTVDLMIGRIPNKGLNESDNVSIGEDLIEVKDISPGKVKLRLSSKKKDVQTKDPWVNEGESVVFNGRTIYVTNVNVKQVAHVSLIPDVKYDKSEADFSFRIGIEKRAIELSPERAEKLIENLDVTIEKWGDIVERLGKVVTGLKGACFATSAVLMIKNFASGTSGEALARGKVMEKYREKCNTEEGLRDMSRTACYNKLSDDIDKDVVAMTGVLAGVNDVMESVQEGNTVTSGGLFGGEGIEDNKKYLKELKAEIVVDPISVNINSKEIVKVPKSNLSSVSQVRAVLTWEAARGKGAVEDVAKGDMDDALRNVALIVKGDVVQFSLEKQFVFDGVALPVSVLKDGQGAFNSRGFSIKKSDLSNVVDGNLGLPGIDNDDMINAQIVHAGSVDYLYLFDDKESQLGIYEVEKNGSKLGILRKVNKIDKFEGVGVRIVGDESCSNPWINSDAKISYYESGDNKGLPAIVPFDLDAGWYAMVPNAGGTFLDDTPQGYTASADVRYFKICNIGPNGLMQNCAGDDLAQSFDANTVESVKSFGGCDVDTGRLYDKAREAIRRAAQQYGDKRVNIFDEMIEVGRPMSAVGGFECQDFMSPADCKLMFNVCDPVICPPSRCDFGGKFPVSDVIQTGIIGSLTLCLPNANDGVLIPVCLSGVHAGLDSYVSILESEKSCLEHNLETGELVGICDEITSVYKCEFFWRQMSPLMDQLIPGVVDFAVGGSRVRGGGEYALVPQAWNTMKQSVSFFKDTYAQNAFRAFNIRSTQDVGSSFCKAFVGTSVPGSANFIEDLLAPESPVQFYAQFDEKPFTEATVPATGQYKVYFHIYAGNDQGVQYRVYLRDPPATSYYATTPEISDSRMSGYIAAGSSADKSIDFTAPSGYKELCVVLNGQEECGFKTVTSDFGLDYVAKKYVEDQATEAGITSEKTCISGSPSGFSMATLNLAAGADEFINPEIAMRGIVRICATRNPESGVSSRNVVTCSEDSDVDVCGEGWKCVGEKCVDRADSGTVKTYVGKWKDVGNCGDVNLRCWLDIDSVKDDLEALEAIDGATISVLEERRGLIDNVNLRLEDVAKLLSKARGDIDGLTKKDLEDMAEHDAGPALPEVGTKVLDILWELDRVIGTDDAAGAGTNGDRAEALALKASVYRLLVGEVLREAAAPVVVAPSDVNEVIPEVDESDGGEEEDIDFIKDYISGFEGSKSLVYDIDGVKHIGIGHRITADSGDVFEKLFGCDTTCFDALVAGERELTLDEIDKLFDYEVRNVYLPRTKNLFNNYDSYPDYVKKALVSSVYRGEMEADHEAVRLINAGNWREAALEYINRQDYRESEAKGLGGIVTRMDANRDLFLQYADSFKDSTADGNALNDVAVELESIRSVKLDGKEVVQFTNDQAVFREVSFDKELVFEIEHGCSQIDYREERTGIGSIFEVFLGDKNVDKNIGELEKGAKYIYHLYCVKESGDKDKLNVLVFARESEGDVIEIESGYTTEIPVEN